MSITVFDSQETLGSVRKSEAIERFVERLANGSGAKPVTYS